MSEIISLNGVVKTNKGKLINLNSKISFNSFKKELDLKGYNFDTFKKSLAFIAETNLELNIDLISCGIDDVVSIKGYELKELIKDCCLDTTNSNDNISMELLKGLNKLLDEKYIEVKVETSAYDSLTPNQLELEKLSEIIKYCETILDNLGLNYKSTIHNTGYLATTELDNDFKLVIYKDIIRNKTSKEYSFNIVYNEVYNRELYIFGLNDLSEFTKADNCVDMFGYFSLRNDKNFERDFIDNLLSKTSLTNKILNNKNLSFTCKKHTNDKFLAQIEYCSNKMKVDFDKLLKKEVDLSKIEKDDFAEKIVYIPASDLYYKVIFSINAIRKKISLYKKYNEDESFYEHKLKDLILLSEAIFEYMTVGYRKTK